MIREAHKRLAREVGATYEDMTRSAFMKKADKVLNDIGAITIGHNIFFVEYEPDYSLLLNDLALLAHENIHVWQWEHYRLSHYTLAKVLWEHIHCGSHVYDYKITPGKKFLSYRYEQQGQMIQDYVTYKCTGDPRATALANVIGDGLGIVPGIPCLHPTSSTGTPAAAQ
jgi:hypothetical protein